MNELLRLLWLTRRVITHMMHYSYIITSIKRNAWSWFEVSKCCLYIGQFKPSTEAAADLELSPGGCKTVILYASNLLKIFETVFGLNLIWLFKISPQNNDVDVCHNKEMKLCGHNINCKSSGKI